MLQQFIHNSSLRIPLIISKYYISSINDMNIMAKEIINNNRRFIARAITLGESTNPNDKIKSSELMNLLTQYKNKNKRETLRIGISGPPGVGKSTLIEYLGMKFINNGNKVGVLTVDPSSNRSGGSILGDKTRMPTLSVEKNAYIRSSPSRGYLGGVQRRTHGSINILEAAGYNKILVETVGVGQSEVSVDSMVDLFLLLLPPGGGDELQGIKKGVVELADIIAITKADGELLNAANHARNEYSNALTLLRPKSDYWIPKTVICSIKRKDGLDDLYNTLNEFQQKANETYGLQYKRQTQIVDSMWRLLEEDIIEKVKNDPSVKQLEPQMISLLTNGKISPQNAADKLLHSFLTKYTKE